MWSILTMKSYSSFKKKGVLVHSTMGMELDYVQSNEVETEDYTYIAC